MLVIKSINNVYLFNLGSLFVNMYEGSALKMRWFRVYCWTYKNTCHKFGNNDWWANVTPIRLPQKLPDCILVFHAFHVFHVANYKHILTSIYNLVKKPHCIYTLKFSFNTPQWQTGNEPQAEEPSEFFIALDTAQVSSYNHVGYKL